MLPRHHGRSGRLAPALAVALGAAALVALAALGPGDEPRSPERVLPSAADAPSGPSERAAPRLAGSEPDVARGVDGAVEGASEPSRVPAASLRSSLAERYPHLARRLVLRGRPLAEWDLSSMDYDELQELRTVKATLLREVEADRIRALGPGCASLSAEAARALHDADPGRYLARVPPHLGPGFPSKRYVDLTGVIVPELYEAQALCLELVTLPAFERGSIARALEYAPNPIEPARWEREDGGRRLVGYDDSGREVARVVTPLVGAPL